MKNSINNEICSKCKQCIDVCPCNIIGISAEEELYFIPEKEVLCLDCAQCMAVCKTKAIQIGGISYDNDLFDLPEDKVEYSEFISDLRR